MILMKTFTHEFMSSVKPGCYYELKFDAAAEMFVYFTKMKLTHRSSGSSKIFFLLAADSPGFCFIFTSICLFSTVHKGILGKNSRLFSRAVAHKLYPECLSSTVTTLSEEETRSEIKSWLWFNRKIHSCQNTQNALPITALHCSNKILNITVEFQL